MTELKDSGARRQFDTGAVRDIADGKGRCDLLPLKVVAEILDSVVLECVDAYIRTGHIGELQNAIRIFITNDSNWADIYTAILEVAKQYISIHSPLTGRDTPFLRLHG